MTLRLMGAALLLAGCAGMGLSLARWHRQELQQLRLVRSAMQEMAWELKYRVTPLPQLCRVGGYAAKGEVRQVLMQLAARLEAADTSQVSHCMNAIASNSGLCPRARRCLCRLGESLGRYDLEGQLQGLEGVQADCRQELEELKEGGAERLRTYQTLAVCTGAALAILLL